MNWYYLNGLKELRKARKINQKELGDYLGLSQNSISQYEMGERIPKIEVIDKLLEYFDVHIWELLGLTLQDFYNKFSFLSIKLEFTEIISVIDHYLEISRNDPLYQEYEKMYLENVSQIERDGEVDVIFNLLKKKDRNFEPSEEVVLRIIESNELPDYLHFLYQKYDNK